MKNSLRCYLFLYGSCSLFVLSRKKRIMNNSMLIETNEELAFKAYSNFDKIKRDSSQG